jgi:hypothetical protein
MYLPCGRIDENMVVVSFAVKMANCFWKKRVKDQGFGGEGPGVMVGTQGGGGGVGVISLVRKRNNKLKKQARKTGMMSQSFHNHTLIRQQQQCNNMWPVVRYHTHLHLHRGEKPTKTNHGSKATNPYPTFGVFLLFCGVPSTISKR